MAEKSSDPAAAWRDMLSEWEKNINALANKAMEKDDFARAMGAATGATSNMQGALGELMQRHLATLNLPSRAELASIGERLGAMEAQLNQLVHMVRSIPGVSPPPEAAKPKPTRTRQPPPQKDNTSGGGLL